jgi:hypothetical protein
MELAEGPVQWRALVDISLVEPSGFAVIFSRVTESKDGVRIVNWIY